jgi:hypothetical protein
VGQDLRKRRLAQARRTVEADVRQHLVNDN